MEMNQQMQSTGSGRDFYNKLVEEGPVANIENLVHSPLGSGYFFKFCKSKYCSETTNFIIEVDKFIEIFSSDDGGWEEEKSWKEIDKELGVTGSGSIAEINIQRDITDRINTAEFIPEDTWPSGKVDRALVLEKVQIIWSRFLSESAADQICLPAAVLMNTCKRMMNVHLYGREVFQEACKDPSITSTQRDIAIRFQSSEEYQQYMRRFLELIKPANTVSIHIPGPRYTLTALYSKNQLLESEQAVLFSLEQFLTDNFLYGEFMRHLNNLMASENLRFIRAVHIFKKSLAATDPSTHKKATDWAFKMYLNFIRPGCAYEICVSESLRRDVARNLAAPHQEMFKQIEMITFKTLKVLFEAYTHTEEYVTLRLKLAEKFEDFELQGQIKSGQNSLSFGTVNSKMSMARVLRESAGSVNGTGSARPTPPPGSSSSGHSHHGSLHRSIVGTSILTGGMSIGNTITNSLGGLVSRAPASPRSSTHTNSVHSGANLADPASLNAAALSSLNQSTHSNTYNTTINAIHTNNTNHTNNTTTGSSSGAEIAAMLTVVTTPDNSQHDSNNGNNNINSNANCASTSQSFRSATTAMTPMSTASVLSRGRATPRSANISHSLNNGTDPTSALVNTYVSGALFSAPTAPSGRFSGRVSTLPCIPAVGSGSEDDEVRENSPKMQKTSNSMFGAQLPLLNFLGCMSNA